MKTQRPLSPFRQRLHEIVYEADTPAGKAFDVTLLTLIGASVAAVMLDSVAGIHQHYGVWLYRGELVFTVLFTLEYLLRLYSVQRPLAYACSFFGVIDLLAILPGYVSLLYPGAEYLLIVRMMRMLRIFRVFKMAEYFRESQVILTALRQSRRKILVFLFSVVIVTTVAGGLMYVIEGPDNGYTSIPVSIYWTIVTITTVGYGDIAPQTPLGKFIAAALMIIGYAVIAVPTGIVTAQMVQSAQHPVTTQCCPACSAEGHDPDARHCKFCGARL
ncbi:MAG: ion transporter [Candidatus Hydrogenedens sp.]|nr:ion transporter [Candidatus Hydrogenedens sp.]